ncbi:MAG: KdsC family phosphatase [Phycisphaerales bacterium]
MPSTPKPTPATSGPAAVQLLVLDVDGVMTDGGIYVDDAGREFKRFDVTDGAGIRVWLKMGRQAAIITGRGGDTVMHRASYLGIEHVVRESRDKAADLTRLASSLGLPLGATAFLADDWPDLAALRVCGYPMAVANAEPAVRALARFATSRPGGRGAVREAIEHLLSAQGLLDHAVRLYDPAHA